MGGEPVFEIIPGPNGILLANMAIHEIPLQLQGLMVEEAWAVGHGCELENAFRLPFS